MKAAVLVPNWFRPASGGCRGLHLISRTLRDELGVDCVTVGRPYDHDEVGDTVIDPADFGGADVMILPEGWADTNESYYKDLVQLPHRALVVYAQNFLMCGPRDERETHYWSLGPAHSELVRQYMDIPAEMPIESVILPVDGDWWWRPQTEQAPRIPGSILYTPARNDQTLDAIARQCGYLPVFRVHGASKEQLRSLMAQADIFLLASPGEGQSVIMNEAMAMEMAVVTWTSGGLPDIVTNEHDALVCIQDDVPGLRKAVKHLQANPDEARRLGKNARETAKTKLSHERFVEQLRAAWEKIQ